MAYIGKSVIGVEHPSTSALTATTGTFTGAVGVTGNVSTTPGNVSIKAINGGYTGGLLIEDDGNTTKSAITHVVGTMAISANASADHMLITADGEVTMPAQPAFQAVPASKQTDIAINTNTDVVFGTERFDVGANFASNTFTAPVTGKYQLSVSIRFEQVDSAALYYLIDIVTSNKTYQQLFDPDFGQDAAFWMVTMSHICDMDASDTAKINYHQASGTQQTDIAVESVFSGALIC